MRNETTNTQRILAVLSKKITDNNYTVVEYIAKGISSDEIYKFINASIND